MGIRFYCPNGHNLNVKTFLAGKRGICPTCGERFEIPLESVRVPSKAQKAIAGNSRPQANLSVAAGSGIAGGCAAAGGIAALSDAGGIATVVPSTTSVNGGGEIHTIPVPLNKQEPAAAPSKSLPQSLEAKPAASVAAKALKAPGSDPIAESPAAIWYVRPAAGGQFGPAAGDVMRQWLSQRRVGADSMVWREGWPDWKRADQIFPLLFATASENGAAGPGTNNFADDGDWVEALIDTKPPPTNHATAQTHAVRAKGKQSNTLMIVSIFLVLLCLLLFVVMATVYMQQSKDSTESSSSMSRPATANHTDSGIACKYTAPLALLAATS